MTELREATAADVARSLALGFPAGWSALVVSPLALSAEAAHVRAAMTAQGLVPRRIVVDPSFRDLRAQGAFKAGVTSVFEVGDAPGDQVWRLLDWGRSRLGDQSGLFVLTEGAATSMQRLAPHLASRLGAMRQAPLREQVEALVQQGRVADARQLAAGRGRAELGPVADVIAPPTTSTRPVTGRGDLFDNAQWLCEHRDEFAGKWVILRRGTLVDSDASLIALHERAASLENQGDLLLFRVEG
jgi:hypothetical protein